MAREDPTALPDWPPGTVATLATGGPEPHAIPVSTALRAGPRTVLFALGRKRVSLARLRAEPRCALVLLAGDEVALTAHGRAVVVAEPLEGVPAVAAVRLDVERIQDHARPDFTITSGVVWRWTDPDAERRDAAVRAALSALAGA